MPPDHKHTETQNLLKITELWGSLRIQWAIIDEMQYLEGGGVSVNVAASRQSPAFPLLFVLEASWSGMGLREMGA